MPETAQAPKSKLAEAIESENRVRELLRIAEERTKLNENDADALFAKAAAEASLGDVEGAIGTLESLARVDDAYPGLWALKAKLHTMLGDREGARSSALRAMMNEDRTNVPESREVVPCPLCGKEVPFDARTCPSCGTPFSEETDVTDELDRLGQRAVQELVGPELGATAPSPRAPMPRRSAIGFTNGVRSRTGGVTNGLAGGTRGLTNGVRGRTNGLTNGRRASRGVAGGMTNGLVNGLATLRRGLTNGLTNGSGFTNGLGAPRYGYEARRGLWKVFLIPLVAAVLLATPFLSLVDSGASPYAIHIDGSAGEWAASAILRESPNPGIPPNVDVVAFGIAEDLEFLAFYVETAGAALQGGGAAPMSMDTVRIFLDSDANPATGYRADGLGADRMIEVSGVGGAVSMSQIWEFDGPRDPRDWNGWTRGRPVPAAASGAGVEVKAESLGSGLSAQQTVALVRSQSWGGDSDTWDTPLSLLRGTAIVVQEAASPEVLSGTDVRLLNLTLTAVRQPIAFTSLTVRVLGTASPSSATSLRLVDAGSRVLNEQVPGSRDVRFDFPAESIAVGSSLSLAIVADIAGTTGDTFGLRVLSPSSIGADGAVALREVVGARSVGYVGAVPASPRVDGGFAEWVSGAIDPAGETGLGGNGNIDLRGYDAMGVGASLFLYADVAGRLFSGTAVPQSPQPVPLPASGSDADRDTVPDAVDPYPSDFNNDGITDAATGGDVDADGNRDFGVTGGTDVWLNTTIPASFPAPFGGKSVSVYIGPTNRPALFGEDVLRFFLDVDNATLSGFAIGGLGADRMVEARGKDGETTLSALLEFNGSFPGDWSWRPLAPVTVATSLRAVELAVGFNASAVLVEAGDYWGGADTTALTGTLVAPRTQSFRSPAPTSPSTSFSVAPASSALSIPWKAVFPGPTGTVIDGNSNVASTLYNHQRKVVRAGDAPGDTACDATNSDGCWYTVFHDQLVEASGANTAPSPKAKVQNGASTMAAGTAWLNVTIASVDTAKSFLVFGASLNEIAPQYGQVSGQITSSTNIRFQRFSAVGSSAVSLEWYVAEFTSGAAVQRGSTSPGSGTPANVTIASVNLARSFPIVSYRMSGNDFDGNDFVQAKLTSSTSIELTVTEFSTVDAVAEWQVVEYTEASVQRGDVSFATTDSSRTATVTSVNIARSWLLFTYQTPTGTLANIGQKMVRGVITDPTTLTFDRATTGQTITLTWYLVEFTDDTTVQHGTASFSTAETQKDAAVACVDTAKTVVTAGAMYHRGGRTPYSADDNPGVATVTLDLTSSTNVRFTRAVTGSQTTDIGWFVVQFAAGKGCRVAGSFPADIETENDVFVQYREAARGSDFLSKVGAFNVGTGAVGTTVAVTGVGFQPKVVIYWWSGRTESTDTTSGANIARGFGVAVSTTDRRAIYSQSQDGAATAVTDAGHHDAAAIGALTTAGAVGGLADLQSMDANGFTLIIDTQFTINLRVHYLALGGAELTNVRTGMLTEPAATGNQDITAVGFQPDAVLFFSAMIGADPPGTAFDSTMMVGAAAGVTPANAIWAGASNDASDPTNTRRHARAGACIGLFDAAITGTNGRANVTSWLSNGFTLNWAEVAGSRRVHYVALQGGSYLVGDLLTGTDTTTPIVESGFGFTPKAALLLSSTDTSQNSADGVSGNEELSLGGFAASWERGSQTVQDRSALATTQTATSLEHDAVYVRISDTDTVADSMDIRSVDVDGFSTIMTNADTSPRFVWYLAFGGAAKMEVRYDWTGVPSGGSYTLKIKGYRADENIDVQVLTPPSSWNTRITISATTNTMYLHSLTSAEYNAGSPSIRFVDVSSDQTKSDLWVDLAVIETTNAWDRVVLMRSSDASGSTWGSQIVVASGRSSDNPLLYSYDSSEPSIALDASGYLHVVWVSAASTGDQSTLNRVRYTRTTVTFPTQAEVANAANWEAVTVVDDASPGFMPTVSTDTASAPHLAWSGSKTLGSVYYKNKAGGTWRATVPWGTNYTGISVDVSPQNNNVSLARSFSNPEGFAPEATAGYRSNTGTSTVNSLKTRTWDGSSWSAEGEEATSGSPINTVRLAYSPIANERIIVTLSDDGWLDAYVCTPTCTATTDIGQVWTTAPTETEKRFDIAYESVSGEALLVYGVYSLDVTRDIAYRTYIGGSWSVEQYLNDASGPSGSLQFTIVNLASRKGTNQIGLVGLDDTDEDASAWIWDGNAWGSFVQITTTANFATDREQVAIAWESNSGHLLAAAAVSGAGSYNISYTEYTTAWSAPALFQCTSNGRLDWMSLKPNPAGNDMVLAAGNGDTNILSTCYWTGSSWQSRTTHDAGIDSSDRRVFDFAWEDFGNKGLLVWGTAAGQVQYRTFTAPNTFGANQTAAMGTRVHLWVQLRTNPFPGTGGTKILGAVMEGTLTDTSPDLGGIRWNGTAFTVVGASTFSADLGTSTYENFEIEYRVAAAIHEVQYLVCNDLGSSGCDASSEFRKWNGTAGHDVVASDVKPGSYPSLATTWDTNGDLWVAYEMDINATTRAIYARFLDYPSAGWQVAETVDSLAGTIFTRPSIGIDKDNNVHAFYVAASGPQLYYQARTAGSWGARIAIDTASDNPTLMVRAPNDLAYGTSSGGLYWKTTTSETIFHYIPEFPVAVVPVLGLLLAVVLRRRKRMNSRP